MTEDELDNPRALALPNWAILTRLADALVARSANHYRGWGDVVIFAACTGARIGEVSGCRVADINTKTWLWTVRRQTTPSPGGLMDKGTKGKRARSVQLIVEIRDMVNAESRPSAANRMPGRSPDHAEAGSQLPFSETPRTGMRSSPLSDTSTCVGTACATPA
jgi:hypothetical protein